MRTLLIINPYSRNGKSGRLAKKVMERLRSKGFDFDYTEINNFNDAYELSVKANKEGIDNIVAVGGDGTINKVLNGFYNEKGKRISSSRFGVIHTGTSPDFCKSYNIPADPGEAADVIIGQKIKNIPVGKIKLNTDAAGAKPQETKYFACCANIGLGASLARAAGTGIRAYLGDFLGTLVSFIRILLSYRGTDYRMAADGPLKEYKNVINISVGITKYIASGLKVYRDPAIEEKKFYVMKASNIGLNNILKLLTTVYSGKHFNNTSYLDLSYAGRVEILRSEVNNEVEFDGDPAGFLPCIIEMAEDRLPVFVS